MPNCPKCGNEYQSGSNFCGNCGASFTGQRPAQSPELEGVKDYFAFKTMVSSKLIQVVYALGALILTIGGFKLLFGGGEESMLGLGLLIFGNLVWRILCELLIVTFAIHDGIISIEKEIRKTGERG